MSSRTFWLALACFVVPPLWLGTLGFLAQLHGEEARTLGVAFSVFFTSLSLFALHIDITTR